MSYLEKLFIFTLALSFLTMAFMFGLYFDVGSMIRGSATPSTFRSALAESAVAILSRRARIGGGLADARTVPVSRNESFGVSERQVDFVAGYTAGPANRQAVVEATRRRLREDGVTHEGFIEMTALDKDRTQYHEVIQTVDDYVEDRNPARAIGILRVAIEGTNPLNLFALRDYWARLQMVYIMAERYDEARRAAHESVAIERQILDNRAQAGLYVHEGEWRRVDELAAAVDPFFDRLIRGEPQPVARPSSVSGRPRTAVERAETRAELTTALRRGELTQEEYDALVADLGL